MDLPYENKSIMMQLSVEDIPPMLL